MASSRLERVGSIFSRYCSLVEFILISLMLLVASKELRVEVNCEKTKYLLMPRGQNSGQNHNVNVANKYLESVT
jgi:hypothetical protein